MSAVRNLMLQVPVSDYRAMRQAADPLDPKYEVRHAAAQRQRCGCDLRNLENLETSKQKTPENVTSRSKRHSVWSLIVLMIDLWNLL